MAETVLPEYIVNTLSLVIGVGLGVMIIGTATAWLVTMCRFPGRKIFEWALILPLAVPAYVMAYAYTDLPPVRRGRCRACCATSRVGVHGTTGFPMSIRLAAPWLCSRWCSIPTFTCWRERLFLEQSVCALEVSRTLGCGPWGSFFPGRIALGPPGAGCRHRTGLDGNLGRLRDSGLLRGPLPSPPAWCERGSHSGDRVAAAQLASILLGFVFLILMLERWSRTRARFHQATSRYQRLPDYPLRGGRALAASCFCFAPLLLGFLLPAAVLTGMALDLENAQLGSRYFRLVANSFTLAGVHGRLRCRAGGDHGLRNQAQPQPFGRAWRCYAVLRWVYAVPGAVIAVGVLIPFSIFDNALDATMRSLFGISTGLLLTGNDHCPGLRIPGPLPSRFPEHRGGQPGQNTPPVWMMPHALSAGRPSALSGMFHTPLMLGSLLTAALVVFVDVMKELPAHSGDAPLQLRYSGRTGLQPGVGRASR